MSGWFWTQLLILLSLKEMKPYLASLGTPVPTLQFLARIVAMKRVCVMIKAQESISSWSQTWAALLRAFNVSLFILFLTMNTWRIFIQTSQKQLLLNVWNLINNLNVDNFSGVVCEKSVAFRSDATRWYSVALRAACLVFTCYLSNWCKSFRKQTGSLSDHIRPIDSWRHNRILSLIDTQM